MKSPVKMQQSHSAFYMSFLHEHRIQGGRVCLQFSNISVNLPSGGHACLCRMEEKEGGQLQSRKLRKHCRKKAQGRDTALSRVYIFWTKR